jgi:hypothetical protein
MLRGIFCKGKLIIHVEKIFNKWVLHIILVTLMMILQACVQALKTIFYMRKITEFFLYKACF